MLAGDAEAFAALFRRQQQGVCRFALHMCGSPAVAEDVTQEVFLILMKSGSRYDPSRASRSPEYTEGSSVAGQVQSQIQPFEIPPPPPPGIDFTARIPGPSSAADRRTESLGTQLIEGVEAEGTRSISTIPAGAIGNDFAIEIVSERWYSLELQAIILSLHKDPRMGETTYRLSNIQRTEPAHSLFEVPEGYTVTEPGARAFPSLTGPSSSLDAPASRGNQRVTRLVVSLVPLGDLLL